MQTPNREPLTMWVIYDHPSDHPQHFVARKFLVSDRVHATSECLLSVNLQELRDRFASMRLACIGRDVGDDPVVVETWL